MWSVRLLIMGRRSWRRNPNRRVHSCANSLHTRRDALGWHNTLASEHCRVARRSNRRLTMIGYYGGINYGYGYIGEGYHGGYWNHWGWSDGYYAWHAGYWGPHIRRRPTTAVSEGRPPVGRCGERG